MTLSEFKAMTKGLTDMVLSPVEWDEVKPHADSVSSNG